MKKLILATLIASLAVPGVAFAGNVISDARRLVRCILAPHSHGCPSLTTSGGIEQRYYERKVRQGKFSPSPQGGPTCEGTQGTGTRKYETTK